MSLRRANYPVDDLLLEEYTRLFNLLPLLQRIALARAARHQPAGKQPAENIDASKEVID